METSSEPAWLSAVLALGPHALWVGLLAFAIVYLRDPIAEALKRLSRAQTPIGTVELGPPTEQSQEPAIATAAEAVSAPTSPLKWIPGSTPTEVVRELMKPYLSGEKPRNDDIDLAFYWLVSWGFEWVYRVIWGTQIQLLQRVDVADEISLADAKSFYKTSRQKGNAGQTFEQYMGFLMSQGLLAAKPDGLGYKRTPVGHQFLVYLQSQSIPLNRQW